MFYKYLKSMYSIFEEYSADSSEFNSMLQINNNFITHLKSIKNNKNKNFLPFVQSGKGNENAMLEYMKKAISDEIDTINNREDFDKFIKKYKQTSDLLKKMINYIELIHSIVPKENLEKLSQQLNEINEIILDY